MFPVSPAARFFLYNQPTDMRKSFDGLHGLINNHLRMNPLSGDVFIFFNRRRDRIKLLVWDRNGFWLMYKRLEKGRFEHLFSTRKNVVEMSYDSLVMLLEGIELSTIKRRKRFHKTVDF